MGKTPWGKGLNMIIDIDQIGFFHPTLRLIIKDIEHYTGPLRTTSLWRGGGGIHDTIPLRAIDASCHSAKVGDAMAEWVNTRWIYDADRPEKMVCLYHGEPKHLHIQVHEKTRRRYA